MQRQGVDKFRGARFAGLFDDIDARRREIRARLQTTPSAAKIAHGFKIPIFCVALEP